MLTPYEIIGRKRDGDHLSDDEIDFIVKGFTSGEVPDYQMSSFLMAVFFNGMNDKEILSLTRSMIRTGITIDLSDVAGPKADKHSTGGVGDKISLLLAPLAACCGIKVPMVSGRGLGHTGGTIDKLESIPGFRTGLTVDEYKKILKNVGVVMSAQSDDIVPADRKMYALRDVTATVESIPLITSSIMSKKLAEGIDALVLDVKVGKGAFMKTTAEARKLAKKMVAVGKLFGKKTVACLTNMDQPLGHEVGNWNEVVETVGILKSEVHVKDVTDLTVRLTAEMVSLCSGDGLTKSTLQVVKALESGAGYEKFAEMVRAQGGDVSWIEHPEKAPAAKSIVEVKCDRSGYVASIDSRRTGMLGVLLGAGRVKTGDAVDPLAGLTIVKKVGDRIAAGDVLAIARTNKNIPEDDLSAQIRSAYIVATRKPIHSDLIKERIA